MTYMLNYNRHPFHSGDEIELPDEEAKFLLKHGYVTKIYPEVEVTDEPDSTESDSEESETDPEDTDLERTD